MRPSRQRSVLALCLALAPCTPLVAGWPELDEPACKGPGISIPLVTCSADGRLSGENQRTATVFRKALRQEFHEADASWVEAIALAKNIVLRYTSDLTDRLHAFQEVYFAERWSDYLALGLDVFSGRTCEELRGVLGDFCLPAYVSAAYVLAYGERQDSELEGAFTILCHFLDTQLGTMTLPAIDLVGDMWPLRASAIITLLEETGRLDCLASRDAGEEYGSSILDPPRAQESRTPPPRHLRILGVGGHNFVFSLTLAAGEGAIAAGFSWEGGLYGYTLRKAHTLAEATCRELTAHAEVEGFLLGGAFCRPSLPLDEIAELTGGEVAIGGEAAPFHWAEDRLREAFASDEFLAGASLIVCGYPYYLCALLGGFGAMSDIPLLVAVRTTAGLADSLHATLQPWAMQTFRSWIRGEGSGAAMRTVVALDPLFAALSSAAFGVVPAEVPYCSQHVRLMAGGVDCERRLGKPGEAPKLAMSRMDALFQVVDALGLHGLVSTAVASFGWTANVPMEYTYPDLQTYTAALVVPWDWVLVSFSELYRLGIPIILPRGEWMHSVIARALNHRHVAPQIAAKEWKGRFIALTPEAWGSRHEAARRTGNHSGVPWIDPRRPPILEQVAWWYRHTDYHRAPFVKHFGSLAELSLVLQGLESSAGRVCRQMERRNQADLRASSRFFGALARRALGSE